MPSAWHGVYVHAWIRPSRQTLGVIVLAATTCLSVTKFHKLVLTKSWHVQVSGSHKAAFLSRCHYLTTPIFAVGQRNNHPLSSNMLFKSMDWGDREREISHNSQEACAISTFIRHFLSCQVTLCTLASPEAHVTPLWNPNVGHHQLKRTGLIQSYNDPKRDKKIEVSSLESWAKLTPSPWSGRSPSSNSRPQRRGWWQTSNASTPNQQPCVASHTFLWARA